MRRKRLIILVITELYAVIFLTMGYVIHVIINNYSENLAVVCVMTFFFGMCTMAAICELQSIFRLWKKVYGD